MRHVPIAAFKDKASELIAAAEAGEEIIITRHGREVAKVVPIAVDVVGRRRSAIEGLATMREQFRAEGITATRSEIREWIDEGRR